jgi:hypothetical protein
VALDGGAGGAEDQLADGLRISKAHFGLGGVAVDVYLLGRQLQEQE